jgi:hypothetical protein
MAMIPPVSRTWVAHRIATVRTAVEIAELDEVARHFMVIGGPGRVTSEWDALPSELREFLRVANALLPVPHLRLEHER